MTRQDVCIGTFPSRVEAELAVSRLAAQGLDARIESDDAGGAYPVLGKAGVRLFAAREISEQASRLLSEPVHEPENAPGNLAAAENQVRGPHHEDSFGVRTIRATLLLVSGVLVGLLIAGSPDTGSSTSSSSHAGTVELDLDLDGRIDAWHDYEGSNYVRSRYDRNFDGKIDAWDYLGDGVILRSELDENFDGQVDGWIEYEFERVSVYVSDLDHNGVADRTIQYEFGTPVLSRLHPNGGRLEREGHFTDGELRRIDSVSEDGIRTETMRFDVFGRVSPGVD